MKLLWKKILGSSFFISFSTLVSGSIIAQFVTLAMSPVITRLFSPEEFGFYTVIITAVSIFGPIVCLKYDMAIVLSKKQKETYALIKLAIIIMLPLSILISIFYVSVIIRGNYSNVNIFMCTLTLSILLITYGTNNVLLAYNNKLSQYKLISAVTITKSIANNSILVIGGILQSGLIGLLGAQVISSIAGVRKQSKVLRNSFIKFSVIDLKEMKKVFLMYKKLPIFNASSALLTTSVYSSINIFIAASYSVHQLGYYSISYRVLGIPFAIISSNIARVFFKSAANEVKKEGDFTKTFKKTFMILNLTIIPFIVILSIIAPWIFSLVFSDEWEEAGHYVRLLAPMFASKLIAESMTSSFIIAGRQYLELKYQGLLLLVQIIIFLISTISDISIELFLSLISMTYFTINGFMILTMYKLSKQKNRI